MSANTSKYITTRHLAASPAQVLAAYAEPQRLARWWGPDGFTNSFHSFDFTPGGEWKFDMVGPDGTVYPNHCVFEEIAPERIVLHHLATVHEFTLTMTISPEDGGTRLTWVMVFATAEDHEKAAAYVPRCNEENFDRLEKELAADDGRELFITRLIPAPREKVYRAWTEPELLTLWFTPPPVVTVHAEMDVRPGGSSLVVMRGPDGNEISCPGVYLEVVPNERLVFTDAYTSAWIPSEKPFMTGILTFGDEDGQTRYTARVLHWTAADREAHEKMGFHEGWGIATDQLAAVAMQL